MLASEEEDLGHFWRSRVGEIKTQPAEASGLTCCFRRTWVSALREHNRVWYVYVLKCT